MNAINYSLVGKAIEFYKSRGYQYIELPWMVPMDSIMQTCPAEQYVYKTINSYGEEMGLVGSAEQAFIHNSGWATDSQKYVSATPCFRCGDTNYPTNNDTFFKVELSACNNWADWEIVEHFVQDAMDLFVELGCNEKYLEWSYQTDQLLNVDITYPWRWKHPEFTPLELGSYGYRHLESLKHDKKVLYYGTGLALPRFELIKTFNEQDYLDQRKENDQSL